MQTDVNEVAESMSSLSSAFGISRNCSDQHLGCLQKVANIIQPELSPSTKAWLTEAPQTMTRSQSQRPSSCSRLGILFLVREKSLVRWQESHLGSGHQPRGDCERGARVQATYFCPISRQENLSPIPCIFLSYRSPGPDTWSF
jgi:hypothetical protein